MDDETLGDSHFASDPASFNASLEPDLLEPDASFSSASSSSSTADSLANASFGDIEARALEFLGTSPPTEAPVAGFRLEDLPRPMPTIPHEQDELHASALDFLRRSLDYAEKDEWKYQTPPVFTAPPALLSGAASPDRLNVGLQDAGSRPWQDKAFNLEHWQIELPDGFVDDNEAPRLDASGASRQFEDGEAGLMT